MRIAALGLALSLTACGTYTIAMPGGHVPPGKTAQDIMVDQLFCKDRAQTEAQKPGNQARDFLLGLTIVGTPLAYEQDKQDVRGAYERCMIAKGYTVNLGKD